MANMLSNSVGRKFLMALSAIFLLIFLIVHLVTNLLSITPIFGPDAYNVAADFMGYNPFVQFLMQPILGFAVIFHFVMGFILEIKNNKARPIKYGYNNRKVNTTWASRNMLFSGAVILAFLGLHIYDFWVHEMNYKFVEAYPHDPTRYLGELHEKFSELWRVVIYCVSFILLGLHLSHGFQSSFQSVGTTSRSLMAKLQKWGTIYSIVIPAGFIIIALFHFLTR